MPTIEFHGFAGEEAARLRDAIVGSIADLDYADAIVLELPRPGTATEVRDLAGVAQPFVRVYSRDPNRALELAQRIARFCDVEAAQLTHFFRKTAMTEAPHSTRLCEADIIRSIEPIRWFGLAMVLHEVFSSPLDALLAGGEAIGAREVAQSHGLVEDRVEAVLAFLANEGLLHREGPRYRAGDGYLTMRACKGWYTMFVGGYAPTLQGLAPCLGDSDRAAPRDAALVGEGSCAISRYDAIPLARALMAHSGRAYRRLLDLGCGNAAYLTELCLAFPELSAVGVEPSAGGVEAARELLRERGVADRVEVVHRGALEYLDDLRAVPADARPDLIILSFVLHEILGQDGPSGVVRLLRELTSVAPDIDVVIIEVDDKSHDPQAMAHPLAQRYYNLYYLLHHFTRQQLVGPERWEQLFAEAGLEVVARDHAPQEVDSTKLEIGYLLRRGRR